MVKSGQRDTSPFVCCSGGGDAERRDKQQVQPARGGVVCETVSLLAAAGIPPGHAYHPRRLLGTGVLSQEHHEEGADLLSG